MSGVEQGATIREAAAAKAELVDRLEDLGLEIDLAMAAIAGDRLHAFETSVRRQEVACSRLSALAAQLAPRVSGAGRAPIADADSALDQRLRAATTTIRTLNARYSALLRHSGESLRLLACLSGTYAGRSQPSTGRPKQQTWSCEV